jgi:nitrogen fixation protein FixH
MNASRAKTFVFTGWHMLAVMMLFFGTIISVNFYMAYNATRSWSGLVAQNTYIASQQFNGKAAEARILTASGVRGKILINGSAIRYEISHPADGPVDASELTLKFKRPVGEHQDFELRLTPMAKGVFTTSDQLLPGQWIVDASAARNGKRILHEAQRISILGGQQ